MNIVYLSIDIGDADLRGTVVPASVTSRCLVSSLLSGGLAVTDSYIVFISRIQRPLRPASVFSMMMMITPLGR